MNFVPIAGPAGGNNDDNDDDLPEIPLEELLDDLEALQLAGQDGGMAAAADSDGDEMMEG